MTEAALEASTEIAARETSRSGTLRRFNVLDTVFRSATFISAVAVLLLSRRRDSVADHRIGADIPRLRPQLPDYPVVEPGDREVRRHRTDLRHRRHILDRHAHRHPGVDRHRGLPHRALSVLAAPADRHGDRAPRRHSLDHLRHLGPVRVRAVPAGDAAAVADRCLRRDPGAVVAVRRPALRHRRSHGRTDPRDHGPALHHGDYPRRFRHRAAGGEGGGISGSDARPGKSCGRWFCPIRAPASSAGSCSGSAAHLARRWR